MKKSCARLAALPLVILAACGAGTAEAETFCDQVVELSGAVEAGPQVDFETASQDEIGAAMEAFAAEVGPGLDELEANAPDDIASEVETITSTVRNALETGDESVLQSDEFVAAESAIDEFVITGCDTEAVDVVAADYSFEGIPADLAAGRTAFSFDNQGGEVHEMVLMRIENEDASIQDLLAMPEEEAMQQVTMVGAAFAPPGGEDTLIADLEPGRYGVVCFLPVGTTSLDEEPPAGPPHFTEGMVTEFVVEG